MELFAEHPRPGDAEGAPGLGVVLGLQQADAALGILRENGEEAYVLGEIVASDEGVILC